MTSNDVNGREEREVFYLLEWHALGKLEPECARPSPFSTLEDAMHHAEGTAHFEHTLWRQTVGGVWIARIEPGYYRIDTLTFPLQEHARQLRLRIRDLQYAFDMILDHVMVNDEYPEHISAQDIIDRLGADEEYIPSQNLEHFNDALVYLTGHSGRRENLK